MGSDGGDDDYDDTKRRHTSAVKTLTGGTNGGLDGGNVGLNGLEHVHHGVILRRGIGGRSRPCSHGSLYVVIGTS